MQNETTGPRGLGGWLILPGAGLILTPFIISSQLLSDYVPIFTEGIWEMVTSPGSEAFVPGFGALVLFEILGNLFRIALAVVLLVLFFMRSHRFPMLYIAFAAFAVLFVVVDTMWARAIIQFDSEMTLDSVRDVVLSLGGALIWIPYMIRSRRVHNTFVRRPLAPSFGHESRPTVGIPGV